MPTPEDESGQNSAVAEIGARSTLGLGMIFAAVSASAFGLNITFTRVAFDGQASPALVMEVRYLAALIFIPILILALGRSFRPPPALRGRLLRIALGNFGVTLGYMTSILFIPVSLAALVFYTYPLIVLALMPVLQGTRLGARQVFAFGLAFAGLAMALGPSFGTLDPRGIALALFAAGSAAYIFIAGPRLVGEYDTLGVSLYTNICGALLALVVAAVFGGFQLPESVSGWSGLGAVSIAFVVGILFMYMALHAAGSIRTSLVFNLEPVVAIIAAAVLLGERLAPVEIAGVVLVIVALTLAGLGRERI